MKTPTMQTFWLAAALSGGLLGCLAGEAPEEDISHEEGVASEELTTAEATDLLSTSSGGLPAPEDVYIENITSGGPGCPNPSAVSTLISSDKKSFLVIFDSMILEFPPKPYIKNINCVAGVTVHVPNGWQFTLATVTTRGYAYLSPGLKAKQTSKYFFAGNPLGAMYHSTLNGFFDGQYEFTDLVGITSEVWSPCGASAIFAIDTSLNLNATGNPFGYGLFNAETLDGMLQKIFHWKWQKCT